MKKIFLIILLFLGSMILSSCHYTYIDSNLGSISDHFDTYLYDECVYLGEEYSIDTEYMTDMRKGTAAIILSYGYRYDEELLTFNLEDANCSPEFDDFLDEQQLLRRYDIYLDGEFTKLCLYVDSAFNIYLASLATLENAGPYSIDQIWGLTRYEEILGELLLKNPDKYRFTKDEFIKIIPALEEAQKNYVDINDVLPQLNEALTPDKAALFTSGVYHEWYLIGNNMMFERFEDYESTPNSLVLALTTYKDFLPVKRCSEVGKFAEFINQYYDEVLLGAFVYENGESDAKLILGVNESFYLGPDSRELGR
jgi:hypothetical protein